MFREALNTLNPFPCYSDLIRQPYHNKRQEGTTKEPRRRGLRRGLGV